MDWSQTGMRQPNFMKFLGYSLNDHACACAQLLSHGWLFGTLWIVACQASLSVGFSRQEHWSRLPFPPPGDLPDQGIEHSSLTSPALASNSLPLVPPGKPLNGYESPWMALSVSHSGHSAVSDSMRSHGLSPLSMEFSRQEYRSGYPLPSPGNLPNLGIEPRPFAPQAEPLPSEPPGNPLNGFKDPEMQCSKWDRSSFPFS